MIKLLYFLFLLCGINSFLFAQHHHFRHYQVEEGLSNNTATSILQDRNEFLWIGTKDGLNRFDGYEFKTYRNNPKDSNSLGNNSVRQLHEDKNRKLWIATDQGVYTYDSESETFSTVTEIPRKLVRAVAEDAEGNMWFIVEYNLYILSQKTKKVTAIKNSQPIFCTALMLSRNNEIWIATMHGDIGKYDSIQKNIQLYSLFNHSPKPTSPWVEKIYDTGEGYFLVGTATQGFKKFYAQNKTYEDILIHSANNKVLCVRDFLKTKNDEYWIASENGIYIYNTTHNSFINLKKDFLNPYTVSDNAIYSLYMDAQGGIWAGTYFGGINYFRNRGIQFKKYLPRISPQNDFGGMWAFDIREIISDNKNNLWIGTEDNGLYKFNKKTEEFVNYKPIKNNSTSISHTNIHGITFYQNKLWIGTFEQGLDVMDPSTGLVTKHYKTTTPNSNLRSNFIYKLYATKDTLWVGTGNGIYTYNNKEDNFSSFPFFPRTAFYTSIIQLSDGTILAGTFLGGLHYYSSSKKKYGSIKIINDKKDILPENRITYLFEAHDKTIWIATENKLYQLNPKTKKVVTLSTETGLPSNVIYTIIEDNNLNKWVTTSKGLALLNKDGLVMRVYTKTDGIATEQFNYASCHKEKNGEIFLGSLKGLISFNPAKLHMEKNTPPLYITDISFFKKSSSIDSENSPLEKSALFTKKITLPYNQSTFQIDFVAISFIFQQNIEYAYTLEGLDKEWNYMKNNRRVYFTNLPPGNYKFKLKSTNSDGEWASKEKILLIQISPPWWRTKLAYFIYILLLLFCIYAITNYYLNRQLDKQQRQMDLFERQKEKETYQSKIDFFTKIAHEIRTPLTLIKAPLEKLQNKISPSSQNEKYLMVMSKNTDRLLNLTNQLLDFRRVESGAFALSIEKKNITALTQIVWSYFYPLAENKNIKMSITTLQTYWCKIDEEATTKIITNLLDNALKYASKMVTLSITRSNEFAEIQISNDGPLIEEDIQEKIFQPFFRSKQTDKITGTGMGLPLSKSLAELQGGSLSFQITEELNTFILKLPIEQ